MTLKTRSILRVLKTIVTNRVTYRFLAVVLLSAGISAGSEIAAKVEALVCSVLTTCL